MSTPPLHQLMISEFDKFKKSNLLVESLNKEQQDLLSAAFNRGAAVAVDYLINQVNHNNQDSQTTI